MPYKDKEKQKQYLKCYLHQYENIMLRFSEDDLHKIKQELEKQKRKNIAPFVQEHFFASFNNSPYIQDSLAKEMNCFNQTL